MVASRFPRIAARLRVVAVACIAGLALAGCRLFTSPGHDTATIEIDADRPTAVRVITSDNFAITIGEGNVQVFHLFRADTTWVQVPFSRDYDLRATAMFFARAFEAEDPEAVVSLRALVDGDQRFAHQSVLEGEGIRFYYVGF